jgi:hypothetical protein
VTNEQFAHFVAETQDLASGTDLHWLPHSDSAWAMSRDSLRFLDALTRRVRPRRIVEFGAGLSTTVIARACRDCNAGSRICSFEHDPAYLDQLRSERSVEFAAGLVEFRFAPLVARLCTDEWLPCYHDCEPPPWPSLGAQLIMVDGPPESLGGREGVLYQALDYAEPGTLAVIDDANRIDLIAALQRWQENLGPAVFVHTVPEVERGLACALIRQPIRRVDLDEWRNRLTVNELEREIQTPHSYLLLDGDRLVLPKTLAERRRRLHSTGDWPPATAAELIDQLSSVRRDDCSFFAVAWPAFWWLAFYSSLADYLKQNCDVRVRNARLALFVHR